jgi:Ca-activated chloride channel family protein
MGVGLDFNEEIMTAMAEHGGGHYYFIQNAEGLAHFFEQELTTMTQVLAQAALLRIKEAPGVTLFDIFGYTYTREDKDLIIHLPDIFSNQRRNVIARAKVPTQHQGKIGLAQVSLEYYSPHHHQKLTASTLATVVITADQQAVSSHLDPTVLSKVEQVEIAHSMNRAIKVYAKGDISGSRAMLQAQMNRTQKKNVRLKSRELNQLMDSLQEQWEEMASPPSTSSGKALIKKVKFNAYQLAK